MPLQCCFAVRFRSFPLERARAGPGARWAAARGARSSALCRGFRVAVAALVSEETRSFSAGPPGISARCCVQVKSIRRAAFLLLRGDFCGNCELWRGQGAAAGWSLPQLLPAVPAPAAPAQRGALRAPLRPPGDHFLLLVLKGVFPRACLRKEGQGKILHRWHEIPAAKPAEEALLRAWSV